MNSNTMAVGKKLILTLASLFLIFGLTKAQDSTQCRTLPSSEHRTPYAAAPVTCQSTTLYGEDRDSWPPYDGDEYHWYVYSGYAKILSPNSEDTDVDSLSYGWVIFLFRELDSQADTLYCWDTVWVWNSEIYADAGNDTVACDQVQLAANDPNPGTGTWSSESGQVIFSNVNDPTAIASNIPLPQDQLYWHITNTANGVTCDDEDTVVITVKTPFPVDAGVQDTTCTGDSIQLMATPPPSGCTGEWSVLQGSGTFRNSTAYDTWVVGLAPGENIFQWKVTDGTYGCSDSDTVVIYNYTLHITDLTNPGPWCTDIATLNVSVTPSGFSGLWSVVASPATIADPTNTSTTVSGLQFGNNTFRFTAELNGCKDSIDVTIQASFVDAIAAATSPVCNDTTQLTGNDPATYGGTGYWEAVGGGSVIDNSTATSTFAYNLVHGENYFVWTIQNSDGCYDRDTVVVLDLEPSDAVIATPDQTVCDSSVVLTANAPVYADETGYWTTFNPSVTFSPDNSQVTVTAEHLSPGNNVFVWHISNGVCPEKTDTVTINYDQVIANAGADQTVCTGDSVQLGANVPAAGQTGTWGVVQGNATFSNVNDPSATAYDLRTDVVNILTWTVSDGFCSDTDSVYITNLTPTTALVAPDTDYTCDGVYTLQANTPTSGTGYWTGPAGATFSNVNDPNATVSNLPPGTSAVVWHITTGGTCPESTDTIFIVYEAVQADAGGPYDSTCNGSIQLAANLPPGTTGQWSAPAPITFDDPTRPDAIVSNLDYGANVLTWTLTTPHGCTSWDTVTVYNWAVGTVSAGLDQHVCSNTTNLSGTPVTDGSGLWTTTSGATIDNPTSNITDVYNLDPGANLFVWTISNGNCSESDTVIIYNDSVSVADAGVWQYVCSDTTQLNANSPTLGTGHWYGTNVTFDDPADPATVVRNLQPGVNLLYWVVSNTYCSDSDTVSIYNMSVNAYYASTQPVVTCDGTAELDANNPAGQDIPDPYTPAYGEWSVLLGLGNFTDPNAFSTTVYDLALDTNILVWKVYNDYCWDTVHVTVVNNTPEQAYAGVDTVICSTEYVLNATLPTRGTGHWEVLAGSGTLADPTANNSLVTNLSYACTDSINDWLIIPGAVNILRWVVEYNGCTSYDTVEIINGLPRYVDAGEDTTVCTTTVNLYALDQGRCAQEHWWTAIPNTGVIFKDPYTFQEDSTDFNAHVEGLQKDTTAFIWHMQNTFSVAGGNPVTCLVTDTVYIVSLGLVDDINAGTDEALCDSTYTLNAVPPSAVAVNSTDSVRGFWTIIYGEGRFDDSSQYNTTVRGLGLMTNILRWTLVNETYGCVATDDLYLTNALPSNAVVYSDDTVVCENTTVLSANRPVRGVGHWEVVGGTAYITGDSCNTWDCRTYAYDLSPGQNTFLWVVENSYYGVETAPDTLTCTLQDTAYVFYNQVIADAGDTAYVCADTLVLNANMPDSTVGVWSRLGGTGLFRSTNSTTSPNPQDTIYNLLRGKNTLTWTLSRTVRGVTCTDQDELIIWDNLPVDPDAGVDQTVCEDSAYLTANPDAPRVYFLDSTNSDTVQVTWIDDFWTTVGGVASFADAGQPSTWIYSLPPGPTNAVWHKVRNFVDSMTGFTQQCELTDTVVIYNNAVTAVAGDIPGQPICGTEDTGAYVVLNATPVSPGQTGYWVYVTGPSTPVFDNTNSPTTGVHDLRNGTNVFRWVVESTVNSVTCDASDSVIVEVRIPTTARVALPDSFEVCNDTALLQANEPVYGQGHWEPVYPYSGKLTDSLNATSYAVDLWRGITKWVWVIDNDGCVSTDTITVLNDAVYADADDRVDPNIQQICVDTFQLSATDPNIFNGTSSPFVATGQWSTGGSATFDDPTQYNTIVRNLSNSDANVLTWTITQGGCSATSQLIIYNNEFTIDASVSDADNIIEVCEDTLQLDGEQPGLNGHGQWTIINGGGSFDNDTLYNTVVRNISASANNQYVWTVWRDGCVASDTVTVINNMITSQAGPDQVVCEDTAYMAAQLPTGATGVWTIDLGGGTFVDATDPNTRVDGIARDTNKYVWTITKGNCSASDTVVVVNNRPDPAVAEDDKEVCEDSTVLVVAVPPPTDSGHWELLSGSGTIQDSTSYNAPVTGLQPGVNKFLWIVTKENCSVADTLVITNNQVAANAGLDDTVCTDTARIAALGPSQFYPYQGVGQWSDAGGTGVTFDNPADSITIARNLAPGVNQLRWTVTLGSCSAYDDVIIVNRQVHAYASDITTCTMPVTLTGNDPSSNHGVWRNIGGLGTIVNDTLYNSEYRDLPNQNSNVLRWIVYNESCADSVDILVTNNGFIANAGASQVVCADTAKLNAQLPAGATGTWTFDAGNATFDNANDPATVVRDLAQGDNILRWTVTYNGCTSDDTLIITNSLPEPAIITGPTDTETCDSTATLTAQSYSSSTYITAKHWEIIEGGGTFVGDSTDYTVDVVDLLPGNNKILWIIENGMCSDTDQIIITNNAVTSNAGADQYVCDTIATLYADAPLFGTGHWETVAAGVTIDNPTNNITTVHGLPYGMTTFNWIVQNGSCSATDQVQVYNNQVFAIASDTTVCDDSIQLHANDPSAQSATGQWSIVAGPGTLVDPTLYNTYIYNLQVGTTTTLRWTVDNGYCTDDTSIVVTNANFYVNAYPDTVICADSLQLIGTDPGTGSGYWDIASAGSGTYFSDPNNDTTMVYNLVRGENKLVWVVTRGICTNTDTVTVVNSLPSEAIITGDRTPETCDSTISLSADQPTPYFATAQYWRVLGNHNFLTDSTLFDVTISDLEPGQTQVVWTIENGKCIDTAIATVINNAVVSFAGDDQTVCDSVVVLRAYDPLTVPPYQGTGIWTANRAVTIVDPTNYQTQVTGLPVGETVFTWTVTKGSCSASDDVSVFNRQVFAIAYDTVTCTDTAPLIGNDPYTTGGYGKWNIIAGDGTIDNDTAPSTIIRDLNYQSTVTLTWYVSNGICDDYDTIKVVSNNFYVSAGIDDTVCSDTAYLNASDLPGTGATGYWSVVGGSGTFDNSTSNITMVTGLAPGANTLRWTVTWNGCTHYDDVVIYNSEPSDPVILTQNDTVVCDGQITLRADQPIQGQGYWEQLVGTGLTGTVDTNIVTVTGLAQNTNLFRWTVQKGKCVKTADVSVINNQVIANAGVDDTICVDTVRLAAAPPVTGATGQWADVSSIGLTFSDVNDPNATVYNIPQQSVVTLSWTVTKGSCSDVDYVRIYNYGVNATASNQVTCDTSVVLDGNDPATFTLSPTHGLWTAVSGSGVWFDDPTNPTTRVNGLPYSSITTLQWKVYNDFGCADSVQITIENNGFQVFAGGDQTVCADTALLTGTDPAPGTGEWSIRSAGTSASITFDDPNAASTVVRGLGYGDNILQWKVVRGACSDSATVVITNAIPYPVNIIAPADGSELCTDSVQVQAQAPVVGTGSWVVYGGATIISGTSNSLNATIGNLLPDTNKITWVVDNNGCTASTDVYVVNNMVLSNAGTDDTVCSDTAVLAATRPSDLYGGTAHWEAVPSGVTFSDVTSPTAVARNLIRGVNELVWVVEKGSCTASDTVKVYNFSVYASALNSEVCDTSVRLNANDPSTLGAHGRWKSISSTSIWFEDDTLYNTWAHGLPYESVSTLLWTVYNDYGCYDSVYVQVTNNGFSLSAGNDKTVCADTALLQGDDPAPGTGVWSISSGYGEFDDSTAAITVVRNLNPGSNIFTWTVTKNGCTENANVTITNNSITTDAGPDQALCTDSVQLNAQDPSVVGGTGYWQRISGAGNFEDSTLYNTWVYGLRRGDNTFRWTLEANGCSAYDDVVIVNNSFDVNAGFDQVVCADTALLKPEPIDGGVGVWSVQGTSGATIDDPNADTTVVRNLDQGINIFRWTVTKNGCTFYDDVVITNDLPNVPVIYTASDTVCEDSIRLEARAPDTDETGLWTYTGSGGDIVSPTNNVTDVVNLNPGATEFIWTLTHNSCSLSTSIVIVNNSVTANAGSDQLDLCQDYTNLNAVEPVAPAYGWWTKGDGQPGVIDDTNSAVTAVTNLGYGENKFVWHVQKGKCSATDTVLIINNSASPAIVGTVPPTCDGTAYLSATPPLYGTGEWSYIGTAPVVISSPSSSNTQVSNLAYGANLFVWTVTNVTPYTTCTDDTTLTVLNYEFTIDAGADIITCDSIEYLQAETRPEQDSAYWTVITGQGSVILADSTDPNTQITIHQGGSAVLKWSVWEHGCYDEDYVTVQNKGVTAMAFDRETCDSTATLTAVAPGTGNHGYWTASYPDITFTPSDTLYNATAENLHVGANYLTWHVYNDLCEDSISITVNYLVPYAYAGSDQEICTNEYKLSANDPSLQGGSGQWSVYRGGGTFDNDTLYNTTVRNLDKGENILIWTVTVRGCSNRDYITLINNTPFVSVDNNPMEICTDSTTLTGNQPDTAAGEYGYWTKITPGPHEFEDSTKPNTKVYGILPGSEILRWTIVNGKCSAYADLTINNNFIQAFAGNDFEVCADSAQLGAYSPYDSSGYWQVITPGPTIDDSTLYNTWVHNLQFGDNVFRWTVHKGGCVSSDEVTVTNNAVQVDAGDDQTVCQNTATLFGSPLPDTTCYGVWRLVGGYGIIVDSTSSTTTVTDLSSGANVFSWTVYNGKCVTSDEVTIYNNEVEVDAGTGDPALCASEFELNALAPGTGATGQWSVIAGYGEIDNPDTNITWVRNLARGENILRWTVTKDGCTSYDEIVLNNITPSQAVTLGEKYVCEDYTTITGNDPRYGVGHWEIVTSSSSLVSIDDTLANSTVVRNLGLGPNQFAWVIVDTATGCSTSDTLTVYNNSVTAFAGLDREICVDTFQLEADDPSPNTGVWSSVTAGGTFDDPTDPHTVVRNLPVGVNILRWTVSNSQCSNSDDVIITNNMTTVADAGDDQISCDGTAILIGNTPDVDEQGLWTTLSGTATIENPTSYWTNVTNLSPGQTAFIWKITRGTCWSADTVIVDNHMIEVDAGVDQEVCEDTAVIQGNRPTSANIAGYWTLIGGSGTIDNSTSYVTIVRDLGPGANVFRWTLTDSVCSNYDEVVVTNNNPTNPQVCYDTVKICTDYTNLCANSATSVETGFWTVASGNAVFDNSNDPTTLAYDLSNNVTLVWHIAKGRCEETDTMVIVNGTVDAVVAIDSAEACGTDYWLAANEPTDTTLTRYWTLVSGAGNIADSTASYTQVSNLGLGANTFRWTVANDLCSSSADVVIVNSKYPVSANLAATNPVCDSDVVVLGSPPEAGGTGTWSVAAGSPYITFDDPHSSTTTAHNLGNGSTILQWTVAIVSVDSTVCENYDTVVVINNSVYANAGQDVTVCDTNEVGILLANDPATSNGLYGYWSVVSGSVDIADTTSYVTTVTHVAYGSNTLKWTVVGDGCQDEDIVIVSNNHFTVSAGLDRTICDTTTILVGTDPGVDGSGIWTVSGSGWFEDPTNYTTRVNGIAPGSNTYIWTVTKNGCTASDTVVITNGTPTAIAGGDKAVCEDSTSLDAVVPDVGSGVWSLMSGSGVINDPTSPHTYVTGLAKGDNVFRWTVYNGTCSAYDEVTITNNMVTATAGVDQNVCDTIAYLAADPPGEGGYGVWTIVAGGGTFDDSTLYNTRVTGLHTGINTFRWTVYENGCSNSSEVTITNNGFDIYAGDDQVVTVPSTQLNAETPPPDAVGTWTVIAGSGTFANPNDPSTTVDGLQAGVNTYRWTVYNTVTGCSAYDDVNVTYNGFDVNAGPDQEICADTTRLAAQNVPGATQYWSVVQGSCVFDDPTDPTTVIREVQRGVNILRWTVTKNGLTKTDDVMITNYLFDTYAGEDIVLCEDSTKLNATYMTNYGVPADTADLTSQWQFIAGGGTFIDQADPRTTVYDLSPGQNIVRWVVTRNDFPGPYVCQADDTIIISYYRLPQTDFITDPESGAGCNPLEVTFYNTTPVDTVPGTVYYWNFANMSIVRADYNDTITRIFYNESDTQDSVYPVWLIAEAEVAQGVVCRDTVRKDITVWAVPHAEFVISPRLIYPAANAYIQNLSTRTAQRYQWDFGDGTGDVQDTFVAYFNHDYSPAGWGTYTVTLTVWNEHCHSSDTNTVYVIAPPPRSYPNVNTFKEGCQPLTLPLYPSVLYTTPGVSEYKWIIRSAESGDTIAVLYDESPVFTFEDDGTYYADIYVTAEGSNPPWSWTYIRTDTVWVHPKPVADFTVDPKEASVNQLIHCYNYSQGAVKYRWDFGLPNGAMTSTETNPVISYSEPGNYYITLYVESEYGCSDQKTLEEPVVILPEGDILFPSAFQPTSTITQNQVFKPIYRGEVVEYELQIYDRWGQLIFVSTDINIGWDGTINGALAPQDVYVYKYHVKFRSGKIRDGSGSVTLLR